MACQGRTMTMKIALAAVRAASVPIVSQSGMGTQIGVGRPWDSVPSDGDNTAAIARSNPSRTTIPDLIQNGWVSSIWAKLTTMCAMLANEDIEHLRLRGGKPEKANT